ncbi:MAG: Rpn family recombination-promoting nuclease/putative transposase [Chitinispirillales bacterium]|jgi:predicted transposase/invertase (TIGR01784 family)|nr:Rpn family recombination-promoting nuclease/putative transposase [Chitinispirillales bacterium]
MDTTNTDIMVNPTANREHKDSVFGLLFSQPGLPIELYNSITESNYSADTEVKLIKLDNLLTTSRVNDLSFEIDGKLVVLIEHQSTINENMPYRMLFFIAAIYNWHSKDHDEYRRKRIPIPRPEFIVLYNGVEDMPEDMRVLKLSDMFIEHEGENRIDLELTVRVYNINKGRNIEMAKRSPTLDGYETFIAKIREYEKAMCPEEAMARAIEYCIEHNILKNFLDTHKKEVFNMLTREWNLDIAVKVAKEEGREEGMERGRMEMVQTMRANGADVDTIAKLTGLTVDDILRMI